jgi:L-aspartate oxidase
MKNAEPFRETDVLIIGGGLAGCSAAYAAAKAGLQVVLLSINQNANVSSSYHAQGGIIYKNPADTLADFIADFQVSGANLVNEKAVATVFRNGPHLIEEILIDDLAVPFNRTTDGEIALTREGAHARPRIAFVKDYTGRAIQERFQERLKHTTNIEVLYNTTCVDLITLAHHSLNPLHIMNQAPVPEPMYIFKTAVRFIQFWPNKPSWLPAVSVGYICTLLIPACPR